MGPVSFHDRLPRLTAAHALTACAHSMASTGSTSPAPAAADMATAAPNPDPRVGLKAGVWDAGTAEWNMRLLSNTRPSEGFDGKTNSDMAFAGNYVIQGSYNGIQVWDISNPAHPTLKKAFVCPASQSDVSVYKNLMFQSAESETARLDCGAEAPKDTVSKERLRGIRILDITDISNPKPITTIQTCRGSHTHSLLVDPKDPNDVYIYVSGSAPVRSPSELPGCVAVAPSKDPNSALFRIEVIKVPLAHPEQAAIVSSPRIFHDLAQVPTHGAASEDKAELAAAKAKGAFTATIP